MKSLGVLIALSALCVPLVSGGVAASETRLGVTVASAIPVGEWRYHPIAKERVIFGPLVGWEAEIRMIPSNFFYSFLGRFIYYDTSDVVGLGEGPGEILDFTAMAICLQGQAGYYLADKTAAARPWLGLAAGIEFLIVEEKLRAGTFSLDEYFPPALILSPRFGLEMEISQKMLIGITAGFDYSYDQVKDFGGYSGAGMDATIGVGVMLRL